MTPTCTCQPQPRPWPNGRCPNCGLTILKEFEQDRRMTSDG
jgi:predicted amidophosphoribosyltransferase